MQEIEQIQFVDADSDDQAIVIVRASEGLVGLAVSLMSNGDAEVFMQPLDCEALIVALQRAIAIAKP